MDRAEAGLRAQTGEKPGGGFYTSSERITLQKFSLGRITTLPRSVFGGRVVNGGGGSGAAGGSGGGGAVAAGSAIVVRPQVTLIDRAQDLRIQTNTESISGIQQSLDVIRVQVTELNQGIQNTARQLQAESALEQNQLKQEQEAERRLAERKVRLGKESALERGIQAALMRPIAQLQRTMTSLFDRIMGALTTLFFGWLTNQGIETLKALAEGDSKKLEEIKNSVVNNVNNVLRGFGVIQRGFGLIMRGIVNLTSRVAGLVGKIALAPFKLLGRGISKLLGISSAKEVGKVVTKGGLNIFRAIPILKAIPDVAFATIDLMQGKYKAATLGYAAGLATLTTPFTGGLGHAASLGLSGWATYESIKSDMEKSSSQSAPPPSTTQSSESVAPQPAPAPAAEISPPPTPSQPQTSAMPSIAEIAFSADTANMLQAPAQTLSQETALPYNTINVEGLLQEKTPAADIKAPPKPTTPVGTLPEAKPNIIMAGGGKDRTQTMMAQQESLTDVPFIPSSNTDNFYVLYSQLNYNVVM